MTNDTTSMTDDHPAVARLTKDILTARASMGAGEARHLVDTYYQLQEARMRAANQVRSVEDAEPHAVLSWLGEQNRVLEQQLKRALGYYAEQTPLGQWALGITGIGPVIAAGLLAHIDIRKAQTAGAIWRFAGLDPTMSWGKGQKRPWNARLKTLCWKAGESFVKVSGRADDLYGKLYVRRKATEWALNISGAFADQAAAALAVKKYGADTDAAAWYSGRITAVEAERYRAAIGTSRNVHPVKCDPGGGQPMLPPARIHARAKRYAVKLFLAHYHAVAWHDEFGTRAPLPYVLTLPEHTHAIGVPNRPGLVADVEVLLADVVA